jgi:hypothetical protein
MIGWAHWRQAWQPQTNWQHRTLQQRWDDQGRCAYACFSLFLTPRKCATCPASWPLAREAFCKVRKPGRHTMSQKCDFFSQPAAWSLLLSPTTVTAVLGCISSAPGCPCESCPARQPLHQLQPAQCMHIRPHNTGCQAVKASSSVWVAMCGTCIVHGVFIAGPGCSCMHGVLTGRLWRLLLSLYRLRRTRTSCSEPTVRSRHCSGTRTT